MTTPNYGAGRVPLLDESGRLAERMLPQVDMGKVDGLADALAALDTEPAAVTTAVALRRFHVSLADPSTPTDIVVVGDSITEGLGASSWRKRWVSVFCDQLRRAYQPDGIPGGAGYFNGWNQGQFADWPLDPSAPIPNTDFGLGRQSLIMTGSNSAIFETAGPVSTGFDIIVTKSSGGGGANAIQYVVDQGDVVVVSTDDAIVARGGYRIPVRGLARTEHSLVIAAAGGSTYFEGVVFYDGDETRGIRVWESGQSGYRAADYVAPHNLWAQSLIEIAPALVVLAVGSNDYASGRTPAQLKADVASIRTDVIATLDYTPSFALVAYSDRGVGGWPDFRRAYREAAQELGMALVDLSDDFGPWANDDRDGLMSADKHHPADAGAFVIGSKVTRALRPGGMS